MSSAHQVNLSASASASRTFAGLPSILQAHMVALSRESFLYGASAYCAVNALLFTFKPEIPTADSFGEETAKTNRPVKLMTSVCGAMFGVLGTTAYVLARGHDAAVAVHCGLSLLPLRMAYDAFVEKITPPPPAIAMTVGIVGAGLLIARK